MFTAAVGRRLLELGSSTVFEAGRPTGSVAVLDPAIRPIWPGAAVCGLAYPVSCAPEDNLAVHRAVERCAAPDVLVVDGAGAQVGYWGEILTAAAQAREIAGLVIDGGVRDLDALARRGFPVFATGVGMVGAAKREPGAIGGSGTVRGTRVSEGDVVLADADGVLVLAAAQLAEVLAAAEQRAAREIVMLRELAAGKSTIDLLGLRRE
jgi:4-hydroxy-4-methyl-2-oxoglutarate aldolase